MSDQFDPIPTKGKMGKREKILVIFRKMTIFGPSRDEKKILHEQNLEVPFILIVK